ncbi:MAG: T9SS type A sorting domain-containing protein [Lishizhenia sp.]
MKIFATLLVVTFIFVRPIQSQTPGAVGNTNLTAWFNTDNLSLGNLSTWSTAYPSSPAISISDNSSPYPVVTNNPSNYNNTISFAGNTATTLKGFQSSGSLNLLDNRISSSEGTMFCSYLLPSSNSNGHMVLYNEAVGDGIQMRNFGSSGRLAIGKYNSSNACRNWTESFKPSIIAYRGNRTGTMKLLNLDAEVSNSSSSASSGAYGLTIGYNPSSSSSSYIGYINEIIFFDRDLSDNEMTRVNSYLAIKFGATLDNSNGGTNGDYLSSNSTTLWDASDQPDYHNDVIGIGRDDNQGLNQKQSHSFDDSLRLYIDNLETSNNDNSGVFSASNTFILIGRNTGEVWGNTDSYNELPNVSGCPIFSRVEREWKVQNTNFTDVFSIDIALDASANLNNINPNDIRFIVDSDGDFSTTNGSTFTNCFYNGDAAGTSITYSSGRLIISNLSTSHFPVNSTAYFTIGSTTANTPLPVEFLNLETNCFDNDIVFNWTVGSESNNAQFLLQAIQEDGDVIELSRIDSYGNSSSLANYSVQYKNTSHYKLFQVSSVDYNGFERVLDKVYIDCENLDPILIVPNPVVDNWSFKSEFNGVFYIKDYTGAVVEKKRFFKGNNLIDGSYLSKGVYFIDFYFSNGSTTRSKLVKL